jgi:transient receptor potential cation channel subfamily A protein 1
VVVTLILLQKRNARCVTILTAPWIDSINLSTAIEFRTALQTDRNMSFVVARVNSCMTADEDASLHELIAALEQDNLRLFCDIINSAEDVDFNCELSSFNGRTPLFLAVESGKCAFVHELLRVKSVDPNRPDSQEKRYPIHVAAEAGRRDLLEELVHSGGADVNAKMENGSTALHILAARSAASGKSGVDQEGYCDAMKYLIHLPATQVDCGNNIDVTPLLFAVQKGSEKAVRILLEAGASVSATTDDNDDNEPISIEELIRDKMPGLYKSTDLAKNRKSLVKTVEEKLFDILYYSNKQESDVGKGDFIATWKAAEENNNGVKVDFDNGTYTFLQYACDQGMHHVVKFLLDKGADPNKCSLNYKFPPLIIAGHNGYHKIIKIFKDAAVQSISPTPDFSVFDAIRGENVLHKVLKKDAKAHANYDFIDYGECLHLLLDDKSDKAKEVIVSPLINAADGNGNTPLHHAGMMGNEKALWKILRAGANIGIKNSFEQTPIAHIPPKLLQDYLDECLQGEGHLVDRDFKLTFDYNFLGPPPPQKRQTLLTAAMAADPNGALLPNGGTNVVSKMNDSGLPEAEPLWYISQSDIHRQLLCHPVISSFLCLKWRLIRPYYYVNLVFYLLFVMFLTAYLVLQATEAKLKFTISTDGKEDKSRDYLGHVVRAFLLLLTIREAFQALVSFRRYLFSASSFPKMVLIALLFALLFIVDKTDEHAIRCLAGAALLLSWTEMVFIFGRHPKCSTYITMFKTVSINFFLFLTWYISFIIAFGLTFFIVLPSENEYFSTAGKSLLKTIVMGLTGELEFEGLSLPDWFAILLFLSFVFFIMLVLVNLLNGLAVSDIGLIQKQSEVVALTSRVELVSYIESMFLGDPFQFLTNWPPVKLLRTLPACDCFRRMYSLSWVRKIVQGVIGNTLLFQWRLKGKKATFMPNQSQLEVGQSSLSSCRHTLLIDEHILVQATSLIKDRKQCSETTQIERGMKLMAKQQQHIIELLNNMKSSPN